MKSEDQSTEYEKRWHDLSVKLADHTKTFMISYLKGEGEKVKPSEIASMVANSSFLVFMDAIELFKNSFKGEDNIKEFKSYIEQFIGFLNKYK